MLKVETDLYSGSLKTSFLSTECVPISLWFAFQLELAIYPFLNLGISKSYKFNHFCIKPPTLCLVIISVCCVLDILKLVTVYLSAVGCADYYTVFILFHFLNLSPPYLLKANTK